MCLNSILHWFECVCMHKYTLYAYMHKINLLSKLFDSYNDIGFNLDVHRHVPNTIFQ